MAPKVQQASVVRVEQRRALGRLADLRIQPRTLARYKVAVREFLLWLSQHSHPLAASYDTLEGQLCDYVEFLWETGAPRSRACDCLAAVQHYLRMRRRIPSAWNLVTCWQKAEVPSQAPPMPVLVACAMAGAAVACERRDIAVALLLAFCGYLRTGEVLQLCTNHVAVQDAQHMILALPTTKSSLRHGKQEMVVIRDATAVRQYQLLTAGMPFGSYIVQCSPQSFRKCFEAIIRHLKLQACGLRPYSLRRGGATHAFQSGTEVQNIMLTGRWANLHTARLYLQDGVSRLAQMQLTPATVRNLQHHARALLA